MDVKKKREKEKRRKSKKKKRKGKQKTKEYNIIKNVCVCAFFLFMILNYKE